MRRYTTSLPREARNADIAHLMKQRATLAKAHKNTAVVDRKLALARAHQLRTEERKAS